MKASCVFAISVLSHGMYLKKDYQKAQGVLEVYLRKSEPEIYKKLVDGIIAFSRGWMEVHNYQMNEDVTDVLTPLEFPLPCWPVVTGPIRKLPDIWACPSTQ